MTDQKGDTENYWGTAIIIVLFFILISFFPGKTLHQISCSYQYALKTEFSLNHSKAVAADAIPMPSVHKSCLHIVYNENINLFSEAIKVIADNRKICRQFSWLQKSELLIKLCLPDRFCYHPVSTDNEELPVLS